MSAHDIPTTGLTRIDRPSIKTLALEQLKRYILSGAVAPGGRLPSERDLAEQLRVGRNSVREALKVLETVGLVESRIGDGTYITAQTGASFGRTIGLALAIWGGSILEILGARQVLEVGAARMAAEKATDEDLQALAAEVEHMEASTDDFLRYLAADMQFHRLIAKATHNEIVAHIVADLVDLLETVLTKPETHKFPRMSEGTATHRELWHLIAQRDSTAAAEAMERHLHFSLELWQAIISLGAVAPQDGETR